jgi:hypothetical protein
VGPSIVKEETFMKKMLTLLAVSGLGFLAASPVMADGHHRGHRDGDRYDRRYDDRSPARIIVRESYPERRYERVRDDYYYSPRYGAPRYVEYGRYCDDDRHYRGVHYHVAPRDYYRADYPREVYRSHGRSGIDATIVLTLPLF